MDEEEKFSDLTGFWTGAYDYKVGSGGYGEDEPVVPFNVHMTDTGGALAGEIIEPNTFSSSETEHMYASLSGNRKVHSIEFIKFYEKIRDAGHTVRYEGTVNENFTVIEGSWMLELSEHEVELYGSPEDMAGRFIMNRSVSDSQKTEDSRKGAVDIGEFLKTR